MELFLEFLLVWFGIMFADISAKWSVEKIKKWSRKHNLKEARKMAKNLPIKCNWHIVSRGSGRIVNRTKINSRFCPCRKYGGPWMLEISEKYEWRYDNDEKTRSNSVG